MPGPNLDAIALRMIVPQIILRIVLARFKINRKDSSIIALN